MIQVLNRALDILELLANERDKEFNLSEIADSLSLNHSTCANIIKTLIIREYITKSDKTRGGYKLGSGINHLSGHFSLKDELLGVSVNLMKDLSSKLNEGSILAIIQNNQRILLHEEKSNHELQVVNHKIKEAYNTSTGRVMLSFIDRPEQEEFIRKYGLPGKDIWPDIQNTDDIYYEFGKIKNEKLAVHIAKSGIVGVAVPVFMKGSIVASLGIYLPRSRFTSGMKKKIIRELKNTSNLIMKGLKMAVFKNDRMKRSAL